MSKQTDNTRNSPTPFGLRGSGVASALIWFAVGGLLTLMLACQPSWPWSTHPMPETSLSWPQDDLVFPEFPRALIIQLSTSAVFFLLVPLTSFSLPRRVLRRPVRHGFFDVRLSSAGHWLMWLALAVFATSFFSPGTTRAVGCWLLAVILVWLAVVLTSAARIGQVFARTRKAGTFLPPRPTWGIMIGDGVQLLLYPFLVAIACGWFFDLVGGSETFVPAGMMTHASHASTGGGPFQLWGHMFNLVAWPTVLACIVPVVGLAPNVFARNAPAPSDEGSLQADDSPAAADGQSPAAGHADAAQTAWTIRALLLATLFFAAGIVFLAVAVHRNVAADWPSCQAMGLNWWIAIGVVAAMVASGVCLHIGVRVAVDPRNTIFHGWIAGVVLLTVSCGATVARQLSSLSQRGLQPFGNGQMVYPHADLEYVSAVRLRVLEISSGLTTREADKGILSSEDVALRKLCDRLHKELIAPTERAAIETQDAGFLAGFANAMVARNDQPPDKIAFECTPDELSTLLRETREQAAVLRLPVVVAGGRARMGVYCLLGIVFIAYLAILLAALAVTVIANRGLARSKTRRELTLAWHLGGVFAVIWIFAA